MTIIVSVDYEEYKPNTYQGVVVESHYDVQLRMVVNTGDFRRDIRIAWRFCSKGASYGACFSSSFDHYLYDSGVRWDSLGLEDSDD